MHEMDMQAGPPLCLAPVRGCRKKMSSHVIYIARTMRPAAVKNEYFQLLNAFFCGSLTLRAVSSWGRQRVKEVLRVF